MISPASSSALPDYYADERRARRRVRVRHALGWVGLVAGVAVLAGVLHLAGGGR
ncbi:MAG TPA: hypothetical protein VKD90_20160 [Gemmataceae bacterium]|nr:hypothetical protein [Gemmataceae bacterium]